jgi:hypothetical protein
LFCAALYGIFVLPAVWGWKDWKQWKVVVGDKAVFDPTGVGTDIELPSLAVL